MPASIDGKRLPTKEILNTVAPIRKIDQIRNMWPDIETLLRARLSHKQIVVEIQKLGIDISYAHFLAISKKIRDSQGGKSAASFRNTVMPSSTALDLAREKIRKDSRGSEIIAGKE